MCWGAEARLAQITKSKILTKVTFSRALASLAQQDPDFKRVIDQYRKPSLRFRKPGFPTLVHIILEQQVSLASAKAAFDRLIESLHVLEPSSFLTLNDAELRAIGFSRQKARYCRLLAETILGGDLDLVSLESQDDQSARLALTNMVGIGPWTADIYLIVALRRLDVWPPGDIALMSSYQRLKSLESRPEDLEMNLISEAWRPWRTVAAIILWHYYVSNRN